MRETTAIIADDAHSAGEALKYFNARWYDPETGRFISEDPVLDGTLWYAYVASNPVTLTDPSGMRPVIGEDENGNPVYAEPDGRGGWQEPVDDPWDTEGDTEGAADHDARPKDDRPLLPARTAQNSRPEEWIETVRYQAEGLVIGYYDDGGGQVTATFGGRTYVIGTDLSHGDKVPFDAVFTVPKGASLELESAGDTFTLNEPGTACLPEATAQWNVLVTTKEFQRAMRADRLAGVGEVAAGGAIAGMAMLALSKYPQVPATALGLGMGAVGLGETMLFGFGMLAHGVARVGGANTNSIVEDLRDRIVPEISNLGGACSQIRR